MRVATCSCVSKLPNRPLRLCRSELRLLHLRAELTRDESFALVDSPSAYSFEKAVHCSLDWVLITLQIGKSSLAGAIAVKSLNSSADPSVVILAVDLAQLLDPWPYCLIPLSRCPEVTEYPASAALQPATKSAKATTELAGRECSMLTKLLFFSLVLTLGAPKMLIFWLIEVVPSKEATPSYRNGLPLGGSTPHLTAW